MIVIKKSKHNVNEDDIQNGNGGTNASQEVQQQKQTGNSKSVQINNQIVDLMNKKLARKTQYQQDVKGIEDQLIQLAKQKADLGEDVDINMIESTRLSYNFWKKLYESTDGRNRTDEMYVIIKLSFAQIAELSYMPNNTWCMTMAKRVIEYLNKDYKKPEDFIDFVNKYINSSQISLSMREKSAFIVNFQNNIKSNAMFGYTLEEK